MIAADRLSKALSMTRDWLTRLLVTRSNSKLPRKWLFVICAVVFVIAVGVRILHWHDSHVEIVAGKTALTGVFNRYHKEARRMLDEGGILFPRVRPAPDDARMLAHSPGYAILLAAAYKLPGDPLSKMWMLQITCDALAAVLVFLLGIKLLSLGPAVIAGLLVGLSPHLAYYSILPLPDSITVLAILAAVYLVVLARERYSLIRIIGAGVLIGISCWLRANEMLLAVFLGLAVVLVFEGRRRWIFATVLVASTVVVILPITIRNWVVFHRFVPLSIQVGLSLVEGIGDFDKDGKYGMPRSDREARKKDAEWAGLAEPFPSLWTPDGFERDRVRLDRGLAVVRSNPGWFMGVMARRALFMVSYNESRAREKPFSTASVPPVFSEAGYGHAISIADDDGSSLPEDGSVLVLNGEIIMRADAIKAPEPSVTLTPTDLLDNGIILSRGSVALESGGEALKIRGDKSEYDDQFSSGAIPLKKNTDYVLVVPIRLMDSGMAIKVTSSDLRTALASADLAHATEAPQQDQIEADSTDNERMTSLQMPFATGDRTEVRIVLSNNRTGSTPPEAALGKAEIFETGSTPYVWTGYFRKIIRNIQRKFTTDRILPLIVIGILLLILARRGRTIVILMAVPLYYLLLQSPMHTEYRYTLPIHYCLFVMAATTLFCASAAVVATARRAYEMATRRRVLNRV